MQRDEKLAMSGTQQQSVCVCVLLKWNYVQLKSSLGFLFDLRPERKEWVTFHILGRWHLYLSVSPFQTHWHKSNLDGADLLVSLWHWQHVGDDIFKKENPERHKQSWPLLFIYWLAHAKLWRSSQADVAGQMMSKWAEVHLWPGVLISVK